MPTDEGVMLLEKYLQAPGTVQRNGVDLRHM